MCCCQKWIFVRIVEEEEEKKQTKIKKKRERKGLGEGDSFHSLFFYFLGSFCSHVVIF